VELSLIKAVQRTDYDKTETVQTIRRNIGKCVCVCVCVCVCQFILFLDLETFKILSSCHLK